MENSDQSARVERRDEAVRAHALAATIALFLGDMTLFELQRVDAFVMKLRDDRDAWARHVGDSKFHRVLAYKEGRVTTACRGSWEITDDFDTEARPAVSDRCGFCNGPTVELERGLAELAHVAPDPRPLFDFEMLDEGATRG